jgi:hypothetical protein
MVGVIPYLPRQRYPGESGSSPRAFSLVRKSTECPYEDGCVPLATKWALSPQGAPWIDVQWVERYDMYTIRISFVKENGL